MDTQKPPVENFRLVGFIKDQNKGICVLSIEDNKGILCTFLSYHSIIYILENNVTVRNFWRVTDDVFETVILTQEVKDLLFILKNQLDPQILEVKHEVFRFVSGDVS